MSSIDVVVPCYKYAHYLEDCVHSVLSQRDVCVRVLIVDDASPDDTPAVGRRLSAADPRVTYTRNAENRGLIATSNRGVMDWAQADYVVLLSADDLLTPGSLARATRLMNKHPEIAMTYGMALMLADGCAAPASPDPHEVEYQVIHGPAFLHQICAAGNPVPTPCAVIRTSIQHQIGRYDPAFPHTSDLDTWMRAASVGSIGVVNAVQGLYRWHASNMSAAYQFRALGDRREILDTCTAFEQRFGDRVPEFSKWLVDLRQRFAQEALWIASAALDLPGDRTWRDSLALAQSLSPDYWRSPTWWRIALKRVLGPRATASVRRRRKPAPAELRSWYDHGSQIGWWPGSGEVRA